MTCRALPGLPTRPAGLSVRPAMKIRFPLLALNIAGGAAVLASYAYAFGQPPEVRSALWGGVPESLQPLYTAGMCAATVGYFPMTWLFVVGSSERAGSDEPGRERSVRAGYGLILLFSAAWTPLTVELIRAPSVFCYLLTRVVLFAVAFGSLSILAHTVRHGRAATGPFRWLPFLGALAFSFQTVVLDALVWPALYPL